MADIYVCRQHGLSEPCDLCATNLTQLQGETLERLPCPFCGDTLIEIAGNEWEEDLRARCIGCLAASGRYHTRAEALTAWNRRAAVAGPSMAGETGPQRRPLDVADEA